MLIAALSYGKFEIIQLQCEESGTKSNERRKVLFILKVFCWGIDTAITYRYLVICFLDHKTHVAKMKLN